MPEGWIVNADPPEAQAITPALQEAFGHSLALAHKAWYPKGASAKEGVEATEKAWWLLRWIYFDRDGNAKDVQARLEFLHRYLDEPDFQGFLSHENAWAIARAHPGRVVIYMDDTVPGNLNFNYMLKKQPFSSMYNIDEKWLEHKVNLKTLSEDQFQKPVRLYSHTKKKSRKSK